MLINEAKWLSKKLDSYSADDLSVVLNVGSGDKHYRTITQPWIEPIFTRLKNRGVEIFHLDRLSSSGVDIVLDVSDGLKLGKLKPKTIMVTNLFEHVQNPNKLARQLVSKLPKGGILVCSCPLDYPFHPNPRDNMLRLTPDELADLFGNVVRVEHKAVVKDRSYFYYLKSRKVRAILSFLRLFVPFYRPVNWYSHILHLPWLKRNFSCSCVILRKV